MNFIKILFSLAIASQLPTSPAFAHSGKLDAKGCHAGARPYHCHRTSGENTSSAGDPECHPSYKGQCVPIAYDVDCAGGSGNGPEYISGPVRVVGPDDYGLDRDKDGWGCE